MGRGAKLRVLDRPPMSPPFIGAFRMVPTFSPDGRKVAYTVPVISPVRPAASSIFIVDIDTGAREEMKVKAGISIGAPLRWSPDGRGLLFVGYVRERGKLLVEVTKRLRIRGFGFGLWFFSLKEGRAVKLADEVEPFSWPGRQTFSRDGRMVAFQGPKKGVPGYERTVRVMLPDREVPVKEKSLFSAVWVATTDGRTRRQLTSAPDCFDREPAFSPSGEEICFTRLSRDRSVSDVWLVTLDGRERRITDDSISSKPCWSPDGKAIALFKRLSIWVHRGRRARRVAPFASPQNGLAWSPDGSKIFYVREGGFWVADVRTGRSRCILPDVGLGLGEFDLSPDGRRIVFFRERREGPEICLLELPSELWPAKR